MTGLTGIITKIFAEFLHRNISFTAVALAIILGRLILKKFPKRYSYALWSCLGIRALFDIGLHIKLPKFTAAHTGSDLGNTINSAVAAGQQYIIEIGNIDTYEPAKTALTAKEILPAVLFGIWTSGILLMITYGIINYVKVRKATAVSFKESGLYRCDYIESPMAFGFIRPRVYIPSDCDVKAMRFVIEHERTHIRRGDVYFKLIAFLILSAYWVNPLAWVAFRLFNLDMELSCDESVIRKAGLEKKEEYSRWLLYYSTKERFVSLAPTAFGETDTKRRVKNIMTLKKKGIIATIAALAITAAVVAVCFILNPREVSASAPQTVTEPVSETVEPIAETPVDETATETEPAKETVENETEESTVENKELTEEEPELTDLEIEERKKKAEAVTWVSPFRESEAYYITSLFGEKSSSVDGATVFHGAVDIAAPTGTELLAVSDGTVTFAGWMDQAGYTLTVNANDDVAYRYCHLEEILVKEGDAVKAGDVVAKLGSTGYSTGPHLHLELIVDGKYHFDPLAYVPIKTDTGTGADE